MCLSRCRGALSTACIRAIDTPPPDSSKHRGISMQLDLYYFPSCPYCQKVLRFLDSSALKDRVTLHHVHQSPAIMQRLLQLNDGEDQVPCLVIDGKPMLESDDIIAFLKRL